MSDLGERYYCPPGYVIRDGVVPITLYQNTPKERTIDFRITVLSDRPVEHESER